MRFPNWDADRAPQLNDVAIQESAQGADDHARLRRAYRVVGVEETRTGYRLVMERIAYEEVATVRDEELWGFYNVPRK